MMGIKTLLVSRAGSFVLGTAAGGLLGASPTVRDGLRALVKKAIKGGLLLKDEVQALAEHVRSDWQDLVAEARAEVEEERATKTETGPYQDPNHDHPH